MPFVFNNFLFGIFIDLFNQIQHKFAAFQRNERLKLYWFNAFVSVKYLSLYRLQMRGFNRVKLYI